MSTWYLSTIPLPPWGQPLTTCSVHGVPKKPEYVSIAETLKAEILDGRYDSEPLPSNGDLAQRFDVNLKTAGRAVQHLVAEGLLIARPGMRAVPVPPQLRATRWPMTGRYARARAAHGLLFDSDVSGDVRKDTTLKAWGEAPPLVAQLLKVAEGARVFQRNTRTYVNDVVTEETALYFPEAVIQAVPRLETEERIFIVPFIEAAGFVITRTANELRARHATAGEQEIFNIEPSDIVIEHAHGTYGANGEPLEAVINVRPAAGQVITFDTYEAPEEDHT
jgi:DNA-binding GntR family transcriptional regulator